MNRYSDLALRRAALTGGFDVEALVSGVLPSGAALSDKDDVIADLALACTERPLDGAWLWEVTADLRRSVLREFISAQSLALSVRESPAAMPGDGFGLALQALLRGEVPPMPKRSPGRTEADWLKDQSTYHADVLSAAEVAATVPALDARAIDAIAEAAQSQIKLLQRRRDIEIVLPTQLHGRSHYQRRLSRFLRGKDGDDSRPLLLTGIGGAGKSALLAQLIDGWRTKAGAPLTVLLDFDRELLRAGEPVRIVGETLRQLTTALMEKGGLEPEVLDPLVAGLSQLRHDLPATDEQGQGRDFQSQVSRLSTEYLIRLQDDWAAPLRACKIALIMDSFEAMGRKNGVAVSTVANVEVELRLVLPKLRSIISGRSAPLEEPELTQRVGPPRRRIHLGGLGPVSGARMICDHDAKGFFQTSAQRRAASRILGGHPLALIVLGRYVQRLDDPPDQLLRDLARDGDFRAEFAQVFLYTRILDRISDDEIGELAHPGLVLRRLNADLIRLVLAEPCLGRPVTATEARDLIDRLREEYWLVEPATPPFDLRHQPDLRRPMLPGLFAGPGARDRTPEDIQRKSRLAASARDVARSAALLFQNGPAADDAAHVWWRDMPKDSRDAEAAYYRAVAGDPVEAFDSSFATAMFVTLGEDIETLPRDWQVRITALRGGEVATEDIGMLDEALQQAVLARQSRATRQVGAGAARKAAPRPQAPPSGFGDTFLDVPKVVVPDDPFAGLVLPDGRVTQTDPSPEPAQEFAADEVYVSQGAGAAGSAAHSGAARIALAATVQANFDEAKFDTATFTVPAMQYLRAIGRDGRFYDPVPETQERQAVFEHPLWFTVLYVATMPDPSGFAPRGGVPREAMAMPFGQALFQPSGPVIRSLFGPEGALVPAVGDSRAEDINRPAGYRAFHMVATPDEARDPEPVLRLQINGFALAAARFVEGRSVTLSDVLMASGTAQDSPPSAFGRESLLAVLRGTLDGPEPPGLRQFGEAYARAMDRMMTLPELPAVPPEGLDLMRVMLRGLSPELHNPIISVLVSLDPGQVRDIAGQLAALTPNWPRELRFEGKQSYRDVQAPTVVEIADQCGLLRDLCVIIANYDPRGTLLAQMHDRITEWFFADLGPEEGLPAP